MFTTINNYPQLQFTAPNSWTLQDLTNFVDESQFGFYWFYITGPAAKTITNGIVKIWSIVTVFKRSDVLAICEIHPCTSTLPILAIRKDPSGWDAAFRVRGSVTT